MSAPRATIDSLRFARTGESLSGEVRVADLERLSSALAEPSGWVRYRLEGGSEAGRPVLRLDVEAEVVLECQRCLGNYIERVSSATVLPLARDEAELARWERDDPLLDALVAETALDVLSLVEDEVLLGLPVAPRHPEGDCQAMAGGADTD